MSFFYGLGFIGSRGRDLYAVWGLSFAQGIGLLGWVSCAGLNPKP